MNNDSDRDLVRINIEAAERRWVREEQRDSNQSKIIVLITVCIISIIGSSFIFSGMYTNFFYEKGKNDLTAAINSIEAGFKSYKPLNQRPNVLNNHPLKTGGLERLATESRDTGRISPVIHAHHTLF